jgi:pimeloyl-ACP methyl ester carboxylesterase
MKMHNKSKGHCVWTFAAIASWALLLWGGILGNAAVAQQQQSQVNNQTLSSVQKQQLSEGISFEIDNVTFSHHMASVNGIQMHYVIGGQGDPVVLLHGWPQTWYEWRHVMPALARNYTVIAPDLRGLGDSSKPVTGYDGNTTAEDIYQLVSQLRLGQKIYLVGHDVGAQTAYSYAAIHPNNVSKLVIMDYVFPGFYPPNLEGVCCWWFSFHQTRDVPELLTAGKEREYLSWFYRGLAYNPEAITEADIDKYVSSYSASGGMRAGFEYYRAFPVNAEQNKVLSETKLQIPVLALGGDIYPALGGDAPGNFALDSTQGLAESVKGIIVPLSGHYIPEEQPEFVIDQLSSFFGNSTTTTTTITPPASSPNSTTGNTTALDDRTAPLRNLLEE